MALIMVSLGLGGLSVVSVMAAPKEPERISPNAAQTDYDRGAGSRVDVWERTKENAAEDLRSVDLNPEGGKKTEISSQNIMVDEKSKAKAADLYERLVADKDETSFGEFLENLDHYDEVLDDPEGDYSKLGPRISRLEDMDYNWEPIPSEKSSWNRGKTTSTGSWTPKPNKQARNFTQTRTNTVQTYRNIIKKEQNIATGEVRTVDTITEYGTDTVKESRLVKALSSPTGGKEGWSDWTDIKGRKQERKIYYVAANTGSLIASNREVENLGPIPPRLACAPISAGGSFTVTEDFIGEKAAKGEHGVMYSLLSLDSRPLEIYGEDKQGNGTTNHYPGRDDMKIKMGSKISISKGTSVTFG